MKRVSIIPIVVLIVAAVYFMCPNSGTKAVDVESSVSFNIDPYAFDIDSLSGRGDTLRIVHYGDTIHIPAVFPSNLLLEFDYIDADTCFRYYFNGLDSITVYLNLLTGRSDKSFTSVYYDTLGAELADFYQWIDCVPNAADLDDTLFGPWWTFQLEVLHWDENSTRYNSSVKDSIKWQTIMSLMDFPR